MPGSKAGLATARDLKVRRSHNASGMDLLLFPPVWTPPLEFQMKRGRLGRCFFTWASSSLCLKSSRIFLTKYNTQKPFKPFFSNERKHHEPFLQNTRHNKLAFFVKWCSFHFDSITVVQTPFVLWSDLVFACYISQAVTNQSKNTFIKKLWLLRQKLHLLFSYCIYMSCVTWVLY